MYCSKCGTRNDDKADTCLSCGAVLQATVPPAPRPPASDGTLGGLIPYHNSAALTGYYLGIFSIVCGLFLGIPALILGIKGLKFANLHPEAKGKAHAWTAIILGSLTTLVTLGIAVAVFIAATMSER